MNATKEELLHQLSILQQKEEELVMMIQGIDSTFQELGYRVDSSLNNANSFAAQTGIRMKGQLSFRGKEKAAEYFDLLDIDGDGYLNYEDFRAVRAFRNEHAYVDATEVQSCEAWKMYMADMKLPTTETGGISKDQYMRYRERIESEQPLSTELEHLHLGYLPPKQKEWLRIKQVIQEHMDFRSSRLPPGTYANTVNAANAAIANQKAIEQRNIASRNKSRPSTAASTGEAARGPSTGEDHNNGAAATVPVPEPVVLANPNLQDENFAIEDISYFLSNCDMNIVATKPEIAQLLLDRCRRKIVLQQLLFKYAKRNLSQPDFPFSLNPADGRLALRFDPHGKLLTSDHIQTIHRRELIPWMVGLPQLFDTKELYRKLIDAKNKFFRGIRYVESITRHMFHFAGHMNDRLIFRDFGPFNRIPKVLQEISNFKFGLSVGDESRRDGGLSGSFKLIKVDTPAAYFKNLKVAADCGSVLMLDWLFHVDTTEEEAKACALSVRQFLGHHLEKELRGNKLFNGLIVSPAVNESDDSKVLRIIFPYKRMVSLDGWLDHMLIPYQVTDFLTMFVGEFRTNFDIADAVKNRTTSLTETFAGSVEITVGLRRNLLMQLLERVVLAVSAGVTPEQVGLKDEAEAAAEAQAELELQNKPKSPFKSTAKPNTAHARSAAIQEEENARRLERWKYVYPFYAYIYSGVAYVLHLLKGMKTAVLKLKFNDAGECVHRMGVMNQTFGRYMRRDWTHKVGYIRDMYNKFVQNYSNQFGKLHGELKDYLETKKRTDEARRKAELLAQYTADAAEKEKDKQSQSRNDAHSSTLEKLKRLGIDTHGENLFHEDAADPAEYVKSLREEGKKQDILNLITVESLRKHVTGLHSAELITGKAKLSIVVQGLDIFDLLPELPNMKSVQEANFLRPPTKGKR